MKRLFTIPIIGCLAIVNIFDQYNLSDYFSQDTTIIKGTLKNRLTYNH